MSFKQLSLLLTIGYFIGHTPLPRQIEKKTRGQRIYHIVMFGFLTFGLVNTLMKRKFYTNFGYIKMILTLLSQLCIHSLSFYSMVVMNLSKKPSWGRLLNNLNSTSHLLQSNQKSTVSSKFVVILLNLLHLATSGCVMYILYKNNITEYLSKNLIFYVQLYLHFFQKLLFYVLVNMILSRYRGLRNLLLNHAKTLNKQTLQLVLIERVERTMRLLKKTVDIFNSMFAWPNFFLMSSTVLIVLSITDYSLFRNNQINMYEAICISLIFLGWNLVGTVILILQYDSVLQEADKIVGLSHDLKWTFEGRALEELRLEEFSNFLIKNLPTFTAAGMFDIRRKTILKMAKTIVTFLIVVIQFGIQE